MPRPIRVPILGQDKYSTILGKASRDIGSFAQKIGSVGRSMTTHLTLPIAAAGTAFAVASMQMNAGMANVATLIPGNSARVIELKRNVQDLAIATGKSTQDLAGGLYQVISAFGDAADTAQKLDINARAAAAGLATTTDAINLTSAVTKAYGDTSAAAIQRVADLSFQTVKLGQTTFPELSSSIGRVTPLAKELGISMEEMFAVFATGTGVTGVAAEVSTQMASAMAGLLKPTSKLASLYDYLGVKSGKALIQQLGFRGALAKVAEEARKADVPLAELLGRKEGMILTLALAGEQADTYTQKLGAMRSASGALDAAFREQTDGINRAGFAWARAKQQVIVFAQKMGDTLAPAIEAVIGWVAPLIDRLGDLSPTTKRVALVMAGLVAAIGPVLVVVGAIAGAIALIATPIGVTVAAISAGIVIIGGLATLVISKWDAVKGFFVGTWDFLKKLFNSRIGQLVLLTNPLTILPTLMIKHWSKFVGAFKAVWGVIKSIGEQIGELFTRLADKMQPFTDTIKSVFGAGSGIAGRMAKWLLGNDEGTAFFADSGGPSGAPVGADQALRNYVEVRRSEHRRDEQHVRVSFDGMPRGARVTQESGNPLDMDLGYAFGW